MAPDPPAPRIGPRELAQAVSGPLGRDLAAAGDLSDPAVLAAVRRAHPRAAGDLVAAVASQVALRRQAAARLGPWSQHMIVDDEALQQASRIEVARWRASQVAERWGGSGTIADIGCGVGIDTRALGEAGLPVRAIERDPWRAEAAEINVVEYAAHVHVVCADATGAGDLLDGCDLAFVDPARRAHGGPRGIDGGRSRTIGSPRDWSPPWPWVVQLAERMPVVAKVAPGFDPGHAPEGADVDWVECGGDLVEATVWMGPDARRRRRAVAIDGDRIDTIEASASRRGEVATQAGAFLLEPGPAVIRAGLVGELAERLGAARLDAGTWLTSALPSDTPLARTWRVIDQVPYAARGLRAWLRPYGAVTWKTSDAGVSAAEWGARVGHRATRGGEHVTVAVTGQARAFAVVREH